MRLRAAWNMARVFSLRLLLFEQWPEILRLPDRRSAANRAHRNKQSKKRKVVSHAATEAANATGGKASLQPHPGSATRILCRDSQCTAARRGFTADLDSVVI
jgi:hypothetical protein